MEPEIEMYKSRPRWHLIVSILLACAVTVVIMANINHKKGYQEGYKKGFGTGAMQGYKVGLETGRGCITDKVKGKCEGLFTVEGDDKGNVYWKTETQIYEFKEGELDGQIRDLKGNE